MTKSIITEYLFLINLINYELDFKNENLFSAFQGIYQKNLIQELSKCEIEIINFIEFYMNFNSTLEYNKNFDLYFKTLTFKENIRLKEINFSYNNELFFLKNDSLFYKKNYTLNNLILKKNIYNFNNNYIFNDHNNKYYLFFFKNNYFNITKTINFIFNIDLIQLLENKNNLNLTNLNLTNLKSYKNISKNIINKYNILKQDNEKIYLKFYKNIDYFDSLNLNVKNLDLVKNHFVIMSNLYTTEYNFKLLINFFKTNTYKEYYLKLPINYTDSKICNNNYNSYYGPSLDYYLNNLSYDKIIYNQNGNNIKESLILIKKNFYKSPLFFNYKFSNKFSYFANKKYNLNIKDLKSYNLDLFNVSKTKKIIPVFKKLDYIYYAHSNEMGEVSRASSIIQYYLPRIKPFIQPYTSLRKYTYDRHLGRILNFSVETRMLRHRILYNHYLYGLFKGGVLSLVNFTELDMFYNKTDTFFFKNDTFNKQHHYVSNLNNISLVKKLNNNPRYDFIWERNQGKVKFFRNNIIYEKTKYERALNLMFNFNEELKPNNTLKEYFCNLLFGFIKDNNQTYITFKDHYNKNNFLSKHILYRINNSKYNKNLKSSIFYKEYLNILDFNTWEKPFDFEKVTVKNLPLYLHTKFKYTYPGYTVWPISEDLILKSYKKRGFLLYYRQIVSQFYNFLSRDIVPMSRFLKTGQISQSIYNRYFNFIPFISYVNKFDFIKKSNDYTKRLDFISFLPKFKIFDLKIFESLEGFKFFDKNNSVLIKFNNNLYHINNQKIDQSLYNLKSFNNKMINYIPDIFYEKYATLEWNNQLFFKILNRKLLYKHIISFGDLSNLYVQKIIYYYAKTIFFEEKLRNTFFNRDIFKYKNFEAINDFIKFKSNNSKKKSLTLLSYNNENLNFYKNFKNMNKILINPYLHVKNHFKIFTRNSEVHKRIYYFECDLSQDFLYLKRAKYMLEDFYKKFFSNIPEGISSYEYLNINNDKILQKELEEIYNYTLIQVKRYNSEQMTSNFKLYSYPILDNIIFLEYYRYFFRKIYIFTKFNMYTDHFMCTSETQRYNTISSREHISGLKFFTYCIPSNYLGYLYKNYLILNQLTILDKISSLILNLNLKLLCKLDKFDYFFKLDNKINIKEINLIKKKNLNNYKLYKNRLIPEAGLYSFINKNSKLKDEDYFLLYNRKRLDNEVIYKSWHSTKFLNKKIDYYQKSNFFDLEKKFDFFYNTKIYKRIRLKDVRFWYRRNFFNTSFLDFFSTDVRFNRTVFHTLSGNTYIRNINFVYPQTDIEKVKLYSFISFIKEKIRFLQKDRYLNGSFKNTLYRSKRLNYENDYSEYDDYKRATGIYQTGYQPTVKFINDFTVYYRRFFYFDPNYTEEDEIPKINMFKTNLKSLKTLTKKLNKHNIYRVLSYFQYYGDTRYPKNKNNFKKLNFIFNIYNYNSYFVNDRYSFENKNLMSIRQFYNHRTTSDYLRNLINLKKKEIYKDFYLRNDSDIINNKIMDPYNNMYKYYSPLKIWEIKLSNKIFPYFYSKNISFNYKLIQNNRLDTLYENIYIKRASFQFRKKNKFSIFEALRYYKFMLNPSKFLNFEEEKSFFSYVINNLFENNTLKDNQIKKKYFINSVGNLIHIEYSYNNYLLTKKNFFKNKEFVNKFNFKFNKELVSYSHLYVLNKRKIPNHLHYRFFFDIYQFDINNFIDYSIKTFNYCIKNNFYVKIPFISELYTKNFYDYFNYNNIKFFKLRTMPVYEYAQGLRNDKYTYAFVKPYFTPKPYNCGMKNPLEDTSFNFSIYNELNIYKIMFNNKFYFIDKKDNVSLIRFNPIYFKFINNNLTKETFISLYMGNHNYLNNNFNLLKLNNNVFFFSKTFEFLKYIKSSKINKICYYSFFNPYDFYIFRYKSSFAALNNVFFKTSSNLNLRSFINNFFNFIDFRTKNFSLFFDLLDKNLHALHNKRIRVWDAIPTREQKTYYNYLIKFDEFLNKSSFTLKYYENLSKFNKKKLEELSFFGFLIKNNIILGIFEYNNLINIAYNLKYENFHIHNNESHIYSMRKIINSIFMLKNKYIWLIFFYYNNLFYFLINSKQAMIDFIWEPIEFWSNHYYFDIPIIFFVNYKLLVSDFLLTCYTTFIQIIIIFYSWFCISGEGLINLKDYIILNHDQIDWNLLYNKYNLLPCDLYGRSLFEMQVSRLIFLVFFLGYLFIYIKIFFFSFKKISKIYNILIIKFNRKKEYLFIQNKHDLELNHKKHDYYLNYNNFIEKFINSNNTYMITFLFRSKHSYKYYKSYFKCKLKLPYFLDEPSLKRLNKIRVLGNLETHYSNLDVDIRKLRTTLSFLNSSYALFTKTRTIEIGSLIFKGNIKRIIYIYQLGSLMTYDPILTNSLIPNAMINSEKKNLLFIDRLFLNDQLKIFNLMPLSEDVNYIYLPKFIFSNIIKYKFKYINLYYIYTFIFFYTFDSLLTIETTLFKLSNPNFFRFLIFLNLNTTPRSFDFFL